MSCNDSDSTSQDDADIAYLEELLATSSDNKQNTIPCEIVVNNHYSFFANALIDTGALQSNYVDLKIAAAIVKAQGAARELEERLMAASSAHTCASCSSNSVLNVVKCIGCRNKKFKNNEDFLVGQPGGTPKNKLLENPGDSLPRKRPRSTETGGKPNGTLSTETPPLQSLPSSPTPTSSNGSTRICTAITGVCFESKGTVENFGFKYLNEEKQLLEQIEALQAKILDTPYDIIIGRPTILKYNLLH